MMKSRVEEAKGDPAAMERLYGQALTAGEARAFNEAIRECAGEHPEDILFSAWTCRLDASSIPETTEPESQSQKQSQVRNWKIAVSTSVVLGILYTLVAGDKPPVPIPGEANPQFWIGWAPLTTLGILFYLAMTKHTRNRIRWNTGLSFAVLSIAVYTALIAWDRTDNLSILMALHLPFVAWACVAAGLVIGHPEPARQFYAVLVKSVETILTGGIFFAATMVFLGLTVGIFSVLGVKLSEDGMQTVVAWGIGAIPILAIASVYDPSSAPVEQNGDTGLARILRILTWLLLPLALGVLAIYVLWFIPAYFWRPFQEREVLIVYNATILAILVLLTVVTTGLDEQQSTRKDTILRNAVLILGSLALLLNIYSLAAIISRTHDFGLTPNRYAVTGWNIVTLFMLGMVVIQLWRGRMGQWVQIFRDSIARVTVLPVVWALWVLLGLPISFD